MKTVYLILAFLGPIFPLSSQAEEGSYYLVGPITDYDVIPLQAYLSRTSNPTIVIHSPGGSMDASLALIDAVKQHGKVTCQVIGLAASGAFGVLQACKVRVMGALARLVTHEPAIIYPMPMDQHDLADLYSKVLKNTQTWNDVCSHRLKISRYEYDQKVKGGSWVMEASEALKVGAVDQIM